MKFQAEDNMTKLGSRIGTLRMATQSGSFSAQCSIRGSQFNSPLIAENAVSYHLFRESGAKRVSTRP